MNPDVKTEVLSSGPDLTILGLFFQADPFVKGVMFLLIFASIWCWAIIINKYALLRNERKFSMEFEDIFWSGVNLDDLYQEYSENINNSQVRVFISGMREFNKIDQKQSLHRHIRKISKISILGPVWLPKTLPKPLQNQENINEK